MNAPTLHNPDNDGWCINEGCCWNVWNAKSTPSCPVKLPRRADTVEEQEELLHGATTGAAAGDEERIHKILTELEDNLANPKALLGYGHAKIQLINLCAQAERRGAEQARKVQEAKTLHDMIDWCNQLGRTRKELDDQTLFSMIVVCERALTSITEKMG